jgi:peptidoglycan/LPS O-acetylase OafA/YrhL
MSPLSTHASSVRFRELDGMRAVAVVAVILFHCDLSGILNAGFFGVDIFFTISGFIITATLLKEHRQTGSLDFAGFYFRRLKRLLPPMLILLVLCCAMTAMLAPDALARFMADLPAALGYASNFWQIHTGQAYFDTTPHVLKHLWSLAVEEQFYLAWPILAWLALRTGGARAAGVLALLLAVASTVWMGYLFGQTSDAPDHNRLYLGTDTHAMGLLAGATLACCWNPWAPGIVRRGQRSAAVVALLLLSAMLLGMNEAEPALYLGCFLIVPVLTCIILYATVSDPRFAVSRWLRTGTVQWLGTRSYSLYLMHWPVFVGMDLCDAKHFSNPVLLATGLVLTGVLAEILYRCAEAPAAAWRPAFRPAALGSASAAYTLATLCLFAFTTRAWDAREEAALAAAQAEKAAIVAKLAAAERRAAEQARQAAVLAAAPIDSGEPISGGEDIYAIGDSVLLGTQAYLAKSIPGIRIDALKGRQASHGLKVVQDWLGKPHKASTVIVHLGTNGYINEGQFREILHALAGLPHVIVINVHADRRWTPPNNDIIARMKTAFPNVTVIDWHAVAAQHPEYFVKDGIHLTSKGIQAMTAQLKLATGGAVLTPEAATVLAHASQAQAKAHKISAVAAHALPEATPPASVAPGATPQQEEP